jgi:hypothetical protein
LPSTEGVARRVSLWGKTEGNDAWEQKGSCSDNCKDPFSTVSSYGFIVRVYSFKACRKETYINKIFDIIR